MRSCFISGRLVGAMCEVTLYTKIKSSIRMTDNKVLIAADQVRDLLPGIIESTWPAAYEGQTDPTSTEVPQNDSL
jgi:hypothetical protein